MCEQKKKKKTSVWCAILFVWMETTVADTDLNLEPEESAGVVQQNATRREAQDMGRILQRLLKEGTPLVHYFILCSSIIIYLASSIYRKTYLWVPFVCLLADRSQVRESRDDTFTTRTWHLVSFIFLFIESFIIFIYYFKSICRTTDQLSCVKCLFSLWLTDKLIKLSSVSFLFSFEGFCLLFILRCRLWGGFKLSLTFEATGRNFISSLIVIYINDNFTDISIFSFGLVRKMKR